MLYTDIFDMWRDYAVSLIQELAISTMVTELVVPLRESKLRAASPRVVRTMRRNYIILKQ
ncbi:hypothetical protein [Nostoc sp.]|uniref:hypothetical protein n=1 Tax=Nostoc sp. TaxID=1180 RepID=UPI002FFAB046